MGMLVISRQTGEYVQIGPNIFIRVLDHVRGRTGNAVRLGIEAPPDVTITRPEDHGWQGGNKPPSLGQRDGEKQP